METYFGRRGYTIPKSHLTPLQQERIRKDLTVSPKAPGPGFGSPPSFPVYRESAKKMYVPRCYGEKSFGKALSEKRPPGDDVSMDFSGSLRPEQEECATKFMAKAKDGGGLLELYCGFGKTVVALWLAAALGKRTIVVVHKDFLVNQWRERIGQFLPAAKVGKIQGPHLEIDGCDIVIAMLQSIAMKDYPAEVWDSFGFAIIDECHHMSAEVFSNALFKIVTPCMLGLSATMTRKDGLSKVFKMFIGGVVAKKKRDDGGRVIVRVKPFSSPDEEFNRAELDFRGQVKYAAMISKVHEFGPRVDFVASIIRDVVETEEDGRQLLVLAQNRCLLTSLMAMATTAGIDTGYYVGGMKEKDLDDSAKCRVILATYGMAEEALDIKGLSTLILATPRTSVEQAVGRILRTKQHTPSVYDVVDQHEVFRRQWKKRLKFYQKNNYTVESGDSLPDAVSGKQEIQQGVCYV